MNLYPLLRPLLYRLDAETAHNLAIFALSRKLWPAASFLEIAELRVSTMGLDFPNPVGLAAGFDKNAAATDALLAQGFGFVEAGTVTPLPQEGNPKPRLFRLVEDEAVINRMGFNNEGLAPFVDRLAKRNKSRGIVGANIGKNKDSEDAVADYAQGLRAVYPHADYVTVNISSPNTPGLRALQKRELLGELLSALATVRDECAAAGGRHVPLLLKIAPDLSREDQENIASLVETHGVSGLIVSNTTVTRPFMHDARKSEIGGLSGHPLFLLSTQMLSNFYQLTGGRIPLIGVGGICSADEAYAKIRAGATLVQLYTALVFQGFSLVRAIQLGLAERLLRDGFSHITEAIGADCK